MVHGKLPPGKLPHGRLPPTLTLTQTVILIQGEICWGGGQSSGGQFPAMRGNQTMKFGQLIEYNMRNIFLEKSYTKYGGETIPRPFSKKSNLSIL